MTTDDHPIEPTAGDATARPARSMRRSLAVAATGMSAVVGLFAVGSAASAQEDDGSTTTVVDEPADSTTDDATDDTTTGTPSARGGPGAAGCDGDESTDPATGGSTDQTSPDATGSAVGV